ncbi:ribosome maturation factor RimM [Sphingomonas bacterium]|uniref:ribosome maturation factor RimM n=1 Tax=Sphingomonas bacterium TaxID=1895847 RepID=UPI001576A07F|nr:ribosome maturation factor RimM [Sphingomonas bacterium]
MAAVTGAHGIGGEMKVKPFTDDLAAFRSFNGGALTLASLRGLVARFEEVEDREAAERLRGTLLTVPRASLPPLGEGEYYHADLIGLPVHDMEGTLLGHVAAVEDFGAGDLLDVERADGRRFMVPVAMAQGVLAPGGRVTVAADWAA